MKKLGRNDKCHCGSDKKYKNCHQKPDERKESSNKGLLIGSILAAIVIMAAVAIYFNLQPTANNTTSPAPPAGEAPAGKVWSPEHGHYH